MNQFISTTVAPGGIGNVGALLYQLKLGTLEPTQGSCSRHCPYQAAIARGQEADEDFRPTGRHAAAQEARARRRAALEDEAEIAWELFLSLHAVRERLARVEASSACARRPRPSPARSARARRRVVRCASARCVVANSVCAVQSG